MCIYATCFNNSDVVLPLIVITLLVVRLQASHAKDVGCLEEMGTNIDALCIQTTGRVCDKEGFKISEFAT